MRFNANFTITLLFLAGFAYGQPQASNLFSFDFECGKGGSYQFTKPAYLTANNVGSYNNQPYFNGNDLYYTAIIDDGQTDIYKCDMLLKSRRKMTSTPESEYSPRITPDGKHFSVVRVSTDSLAKQQLWQYDLEGKKAPELLTPELTNIGYYEWVDAENLILFLVGEPHKMVKYNLITNKIENLKRDIGRCIKVEEHLVYFVDKRVADAASIKEIDLRSSFIRNIIGTVSDSEDFELMPNGDFLMAKDSNLYKYNPLHDNDWVLIADFSHYDITKIKRIALNHNKLVLVDEKPMQTASNN